jgi:DNA polymerase
MIVGEAPGENEVTVCLPFVGAAGRMLNTLLQNSDINREKIYITNAVKCRPTDTGKKNRPPTSEETENCAEYLFKEIELVRPKIIFTLGKVPTYMLLAGADTCLPFRPKKTFKLSDYVGSDFTCTYGYYSYKIIPNYHPSFLMQHGKAYIEKATEVFKNGKE